MITLNYWEKFFLAFNFDFSKAGALPVGYFPHCDWGKMFKYVFPSFKRLRLVSSFPKDSTPVPNVTLNNVHMHA